MSLGITNSENYKNIADAIRVKNPSVTRLLTPPQMAGAILSIDGKDLVNAGELHATPAVDPQHIVPSGIDFFSEVEIDGIPYQQTLNAKNGYTFQIG